MVWVDGWSDPHVVRTSDNTWELRSSSGYCLGVIERRDGGYWGIQSGRSKFFAESLDSAAHSLFDQMVRGKERKARALPPVGDPYWDDAPKSTSRYR
jgi:hypothetical protein